ncbi:MAG: hypothetical protein KatS3mg078_2034 [Deltaproteobacteria bacterium]|nr:MAG: hypothetical protein KatS3mg078_2034 [Deltaproteobacteria bacterium]
MLKSKTVIACASMAILLLVGFITACGGGGGDSGDESTGVTSSYLAFFSSVYLVDPLD